MRRYSPRTLGPAPVGFLLLRLDLVRKVMRVMERKRTGWLVVWLAVVGWLLVGLVRPVAAHNGAVAIAVPVEGIAIDGDLSDWPEGKRRYSILSPSWGDRPKDSKDLQGWFYVGFNAEEDALYVAVEVWDESVLLDRPSGGCEIMIQAEHNSENALVGRYSIRGEQPDVVGITSPEDYVWKVRGKESRRYYEWRIVLREEGGDPVKLRPGLVLGLNVEIWDADADYFPGRRQQRLCVDWHCKWFKPV